MRQASYVQAPDMWNARQSNLRSVPRPGSVLGKKLIASWFPSRQYFPQTGENTYLMPRHACHSRSLTGWLVLRFSSQTMQIEADPMEISTIEEGSGTIEKPLEIA